MLTDETAAVGRVGNDGLIASGLEGVGAVECERQRSVFSAEP